MLVKILENGYCAGYTFKKGEVVEIPENVAKALDPRSYEEVEGIKAQEVAPADKQLKKAKNKGVKSEDSEE